MAMFGPSLLIVYRLYDWVETINDAYHNSHHYPWEAVGDRYILMVVEQITQ